MSPSAPKTLFDKIWDDHLVREIGDDTALLYVDRHLVHEVTSPQAFAMLRETGRTVRRPMATLAVADHNVPTTALNGKNRRLDTIDDPDSLKQVVALQENAAQFGVPYYDLDDLRQGIVHVVGPEQGFTLPGMIIVCGDSHTSTHGAFGALAFGIGTSEVGHVLATQTLMQRRAKNMRITVNGTLALGVEAKDLILAIIGKIGTAGGTGYVIEYAGDAIRRLSMTERMTVCNMSIEGGARAGLIAPDETTYSWLKGRPLCPTGDDWDKAVAHFRQLPSDEDAFYDSEIELDAASIPPLVTWGTSPEDVIPISGNVPTPAETESAQKADAVSRALSYMGLEAGAPIAGTPIQKVFIGSCTNGRIDDLRAVARIMQNNHVAEGVDALVVPGSGLVKEQAEQEGLDTIFTKAGMQWREPGCSMCLAMNPDKLQPGERCASTSNRNFEGRQGRGGRTHLVSPPMAAAAAIAGCLTDVREFL